MLSPRNFHDFHNKLFFAVPCASTTTSEVDTGDFLEPNVNRWLMNVNETSIQRINISSRRFVRARNGRCSRMSAIEITKLTTNAEMASKPGAHSLIAKLPFKAARRGYFPVNQNLHYLAEYLVRGTGQLFRDSSIVFRFNFLSVNIPLSYRLALFLESKKRRIAKVQKKIYSLNGNSRDVSSS